MLKISPGFTSRFAFRQNKATDPKMILTCYIKNCPTYLGSNYLESQLANNKHTFYLIKQSSQLMSELCFTK